MVYFTKLDLQHIMVYFTELGLQPIRVYFTESLVLNYWGNVKSTTGNPLLLGKYNLPHKYIELFCFADSAS